MREINRKIVGGIIFSKDGKLLQVMKNPKEGGVFPDCWHIPGGGVEQGESNEVARLNGYLHSVAAFEQKPDSEWLQVSFRFVDQDAQKLDYLSRLIARGTAQKHFIPGA